MNWIDGVVIGILAFSGLLSLLRGFVREFLGLIAWSGAALMCLTVGPLLIAPMGRLIHNAEAAQIIAYALVFLITLIVLSVIASAIGDIVRNSVLGSIDRVFGFFFGIARGILLLVVAYITMSTVAAPDEWPVPVLQAKTTPMIYHASVWTEQHLPHEVTAKLRVEPPAAGAPSNDDMPLPLTSPLIPPAMVPPPPSGSGNMVPMPPPAHPNAP